MEEILHQFIGTVPYYLQGFIHPRWFAGFLPTVVTCSYQIKWLVGLLFHQLRGHVRDESVGPMSGWTLEMRNEYTSCAKR